MTQIIRHKILHEVIENTLYVGGDRAYNAVKDYDTWSIVSAAKEPYHRETVGYKSKGAPKSSPEYLMAYRLNHLVLNLIDGLDYRFIDKNMVSKTLDWIDHEISKGQAILVHCNHGQSRSPSIALMYLLYRDKAWTPDTFESYEEAKDKFRGHICPDFAPNRGIDDFVRMNWNKL